MIFQEDQNRGKPNWEHLNDDLHVLITVEDTENRASLKLQRAVDEVNKLLIVVHKLRLPRFNFYKYLSYVNHCISLCFNVNHV